MVLEARDPFKRDPDAISNRSGSVAPLGIVWSQSYEDFCVFVVSVFCFSLKLIHPGFHKLFEGNHENLHKISDRLVSLTPLGMVWSSSYEGFCVFVVPVSCFSSKTHTSWLSQAF